MIFASYVSHTYLSDVALYSAFVDSAKMCGQARTSDDDTGRSVGPGLQGISIPATVVDRQELEMNSAFHQFWILFFFR